jgi:uncharacterized membrane protein
MLGYDWPRLHAALNDLPAALLLVAVIFDLLAAVTKRPALRTAGYWTMIAGAVGGVLAVGSGLEAEDHIAHGEAVHEAMETHETLALITLGIFAVLAVWRLFRESRMGSGERTIALVVSVGGLGVLLTTAAQGGKLVFDHAAGIPTTVLQEEMHERAEGHHHHEGEAEEAEEHEHAEGEAHDHADSGANAHTDSMTEGGHTHPPGTPPHKD